MAETSLFGVFSLTGAPLPPSSDPARFETAGAWIAAPAAQLVFDDRGCVAVEGFLADGPGGAVDLRSLLGAEAFPDGHYAAAVYRHGRLVLVRDPSGGENLFYARVGPLLFFSTSLRTLIERAGVRPRMNEAAAAEFALQGMVFFGSQTLADGVRELPPGWRLEASADSVALTRQWRGFLRSCRPAPLTPRLFKDELAAVVRRAVGRREEIAVSLSGGIDSATIAALAVEQLGPKKVHAFTYEFEDEHHVSEARLAGEVARFLGISHRVVRLGFPDFLQALPEATRRMEDTVRFSRVRVWMLARAIAQAGFPMTLTGHGIEFYLGWMPHDREVDALACALERFSWPAFMLRSWKVALSRRAACRRAGRMLAKRLPGPAAPPLPFYYPTVMALWRRGVLPAPEPMFPEALRPLVTAARAPERWDLPDAELDAASLPVALRYLSYSYSSRRMLEGKTRLSREAGSIQVSPAMFLHEDRLPGYWFASGEAKFSDRSPQKEALRGLVPDAIIARPKIDQQAIFSEKWHRGLLDQLEPLLADLRDSAFWRAARAAGAERFFEESPVPFGVFGDVAAFGRGNLHALALWRDLAGIRR